MMLKKKHIYFIFLLIIGAFFGKFCLLSSEEQSHEKIPLSKDLKKESKNQDVHLSLLDDVVKEDYIEEGSVQFDSMKAESLDPESVSELAKFDLDEVEAEKKEIREGEFEKDQRDVFSEEALDKIRSDLVVANNVSSVTQTKNNNDFQHNDSEDDPDEQLSFTDEEIKELTRQGQAEERDLVPASPMSINEFLDVSKKQPNGLAGDVSSASKKDEVLAETEDYSAPIYTGQARGYAMLYLMQPNARLTVATELQTVLHAGVREVYLSVLVDGTFGKDFEYLKNVLRIFNEKGRITILALYLSNGSTMRRHDVTNIEAGFNQIEPKLFRRLIQEDPDIRAKFASMVSEVKPVYDYHTALNPNNKNIAIVMLEDNLTSDSYLAMRNIAAPILGNNVSFMRNPCIGCYVGNDIESFGDPLEFHALGELQYVKNGDGYTLDGVSFHFPWENGSGVTIEEVKELQKYMLAKGGGFFGLWRSQRQGIHEAGVSQHPDERVYEVPTEQQIEIEKKLLVKGLEKIDK